MELTSNLLNWASSFVRLLTRTFKLRSLAFTSSSWNHKHGWIYMTRLLSLTVTLISTSLNALPDSVRDPTPSYDSFRKLLKMGLFVSY